MWRAAGQRWQLCLATSSILESLSHSRDIQLECLLASVVFEIADLDKRCGSMPECPQVAEVTGQPGVRLHRCRLECRW